MDDIYAALKRHKPELNIIAAADMGEYTSFKAGGTAACLIEPDGAKSLSDIIRLCRKEGIGYYVIGSGTNVLFDDGGYDGLVIRVGPGMDNIAEEGGVITAGAGTPLPALAGYAAKASLSGLEFASGIPGSVGGAVVMNAGAYGGEIKDVITSAEVCDRNGDMRTLAADELELGYRSSIIRKRGYVVCSASFKLKAGDREAIIAKMNDYNARRREKQPLSYASAGSAFKRPAGDFAGRLIEGCGLKGFAVGGAEVSEKHAGFVINKGNASAADILGVIRHVQNEVYGKTGVTLEPEVRIVGKNGETAVSIVTFGYKYAEPPRCDITFDARFLPNPFYVDRLRDKTGNDDEVYAYVTSSEAAGEFIEEAISRVMDYIAKEGKAPSVGIGCTGGRHRSVAVARALKERLLREGCAVDVEHRDISR